MDFSKSIEELENDFWPEPNFKSSLIINCHAYRKIPLNAIEPRQIRLLIGQDLGVKYLLPLAVTILENDPHIQCDFFPGDLLLQVTKIKLHYWKNENELYNKANGIIINLNSDFCESTLEFDKIDNDTMMQINSNWNIIKLN